MSTNTLEVPLLGVGTVRRLSRDAWSMAKQLRQATIECVPLLPLAMIHFWSPHSLPQAVSKSDPTGQLRDEMKAKFLPNIDKTPLYSAVCSDDPLIFDELLTQITTHMEELSYGSLNSSVVRTPF